jgi:hypothetical protein
MSIISEYKIQIKIGSVGNEKETANPSQTPEKEIEMIGVKSVKVN